MRIVTTNAPDEKTSLHDEKVETLAHHDRKSWNSIGTDYQSVTQNAVGLINRLLVVGARAKRANLPKISCRLHVPSNNQFSAHEHTTSRLAAIIIDE